MRREKTEMEKAGFNKIGYAADSYERQRDGIYITIVGAGYFLECYLWSIHDIREDHYKFIECGHAETKIGAMHQAMKLAGDYIERMENPSFDDDHIIW